MTKLTTARIEEILTVKFIALECGTNCIAMRACEMKKEWVSEYSCSIQEARLSSQGHQRLLAVDGIRVQTFVAVSKRGKSSMGETNGNVFNTCSRFL